MPGITVLVDEVELDGDPSTILRPPGAEVVEPPHDHAHTGHNGVTMAPTVSADMKGGAQVMLGSQKSPLRMLAQWLILGASVGAVLNSNDIQRYLKIRSIYKNESSPCHAFE